jgi:hypothetical protein
MVADYFEVGVEAIQSLIKDHRSELAGNGYRVIAGQELMSFKDISRVHVRTRSLALFPRLGGPPPATPAGASSAR